jgi:hypothetical protein
MSKFLFTVCAFGLLLSPAFAQEKTQEQLREESAIIWNHDGIKKEQFTRMLISGTKSRIGFFHFLNPDCSSRNDITIRVTKEPEHGAIDTAIATDYASYRKDNIRSKCNQHKVRGTEVKYKSAEKYVGSDEAELTVIFGDGFAWEVHYDIKVR